ncbi:hypothetical protein SFB2_249G2 [Candidatus Arthromitus sp. SFB-2]|nr:hypothetical protein SFB2_249G2 [Candidatus Arthromitus sp. SFB-2]
MICKMLKKYFEIARGINSNDEILKELEKNYFIN